ncbi:1,4-dihydroxy-2-naphthoate polyprenyltransferase [Natrialbaceae archaeon AArc-T1-2]|uniref:1,4-dihydroxy-2-naphthoate polyprenyltransferase n=1 Tax=Natrialbaceae archaeon AArc-T1-2 TaxID=3053904 RepID=UPI00255A7219|nr:1,4-dihydroxy-2-naphthoate polyprenyltransferase [Natrialbaceae archaeon AArc-T1-2]WIV66136.1 1,4-dihydroxy-2-naphthoate polyprenyltransferase [Natrialbaceae archaeon AArc-T1-2]
MTTAEVSRTKAWLMAARPQTLPAAAAPVIVGTGLAVHEGVFAPLPALMAFVGAALIQIGTNFANDYYDAVKGADTDDREGFTRVTQSGLIDPDRVKLATIVTFGLAILSGTYLVYVGGVPILVVGLVSVLCGWAYTGGPYPLGYHGLGDLFVFVFFGVVAVMGTFYVQAAAVSPVGPFPTTIPAETVTTAAFVASLPIAALATNILVVNNVRDRETDVEAGKNTLAVRFGYRFSRLEYSTMLTLAYAVPPWFWLATDVGPAVLLPLVTLPYAAVVTRTIWTRTDGTALNPALERTGKLLTLYAVCFAGGLIV